MALSDYISVSVEAAGEVVGRGGAGRPVSTSHLIGQGRIYIYNTGPSNSLQHSNLELKTLSLLGQQEELSTGIYFWGFIFLF